MTKSLQDEFTLLTGRKMPYLGFGVFQAKGDDCYKAVIEAVKVGYRHIDSAQAYGNEEQVGKAIKDCGVPRDQIFITTKYNPPRGRSVPSDKVYESLVESRKKLDLVSKEPYIDLILIHAPFNSPEDRASNWEAFKRAQKEGITRDIGVSNLYVLYHRC
jgi:2,5-diketo-D-gluconate reductase A